MAQTVGGRCHKVIDTLKRNFQEERLIIAEEFNSGKEQVMKISYLIIICTVLLVSGAISIGSTNIIGKAGETTPITDGWMFAERQIDNETTHRKVWPHRMVKNDAAYKAAENSQPSMEFDDKNREVHPRRLHVSREQLTIFSLYLLSMKPLGHA